METSRGSGGIASFILNLRTRWRWVVSVMSWLLYIQGKRPWKPLNKKLGRPQCQPECFGKLKSLLSLLGFEAYTVQPIASHYTDCTILAPQCAVVHV